MKPTLQFQFDSVQQLQLFVSKVVPVLEGSAPAEAVQAVKDSAAVYSPAVQAAEPAPAPVVPAPAPIAPAPSPVAPAPVAAVVPTVAPVYTQDELARASAELADKGGFEAIREILGQFGVASLTELPEEHFGAYATALRAKGVQI